MSTEAQRSKQEELERLKARLSALEAELEQVAGPGAWAPTGYYTTYHIMAGMVLGLIAAAASLLVNVIGSAMVGEPPLQLIQIYLTFPMGEAALKLDSGFALAAGCCLYLATGMIGGIPFHMILSRFFDKSPLGVRFGVATALGVGVWLINFYAILYWLQPLLIGGNWIVQKVPWHVAAFTHLVFGWTMLLVAQWGRFMPPRREKTERSE